MIKKLIKLPWHRTSKHAIILSGEARSGTTWLEERLCAGYPFRVIFEPLHPKHIPEAAPFWSMPFLHADANAPQHKIFMDNVLSGRFHHSWVDRYNTFNTDRYRLVKFIRANILLPWLQYHYPKTPIILLIRHPIAVAVSKTRHGWGAPALENILKCKSLHMVTPELQEITPPQDLFLQNVLGWCIGQAIPLRMLDFNKGNIRVVHYEHLVTNPKAGLTALLPLLPKHFDLNAALLNHNTPSATNARWSPKRNFEVSLGNWQQSVTDKQISMALDLLQLFKLDILYNDNIMPLDQPAISSSHP